MKRFAILTIAVAALLVPSTALASGVVLKVQRASHLVAVTRTSTKVALVHTAAASKLRVGERVALSARTLRNGTLAASSLRVVGHASRVHFRGLLLAKSRTRFVVSAGGAVISVNRGSRQTASARDNGPKPGTTVDVTATVGTNGELDDDATTAVSADHPGGSIEGQLTIGSGTITVTSDNMALVIAVPSTVDLSTFKSGDEVLAVFSQQADGSLLLTSISGDNSVQQADDNGNDDGNSNSNGSGNGSSGGGDGSGDDGGGD